MGRAKLRLELKSSKKERRLTFEKRRKALEKKAHELSTLCGVKIGMIIHGLDEGKSTVWPENGEENIADLISCYKGSIDQGRQRTYNLSNFYEDELKKIKDELAKIRKKNIETKYPTWNEQYDMLTCEELQCFRCVIQDKIEVLKSRIDLMKATQAVVNHANYENQRRLQYEESSMMNTNDDQQSIIDGSCDMGTSQEMMTMMMLMNNEVSMSSNNVYSSYMYGRGEESSDLQDFGVESALMCGYLPNVYTMPQCMQYPLYDLSMPSSFYYSKRR